MSEIENKEAALQNFRAEIKKIKENFPSLFAVENVDELQAEEGEVWEEFKLLFKKIETELSKYDMQNKDVPAGLINEIKKMAITVGGNLSMITNPNRTEFLAWINNRLAVLSINLQFLKNSKANESTLMKSRESLLVEKKGLLL